LGNSCNVCVSIPFKKKEKKKEEQKRCCTCEIVVFGTYCISHNENKRACKFAY